ncbi:MAG: hypothetical protein AAFU65_14650, partial [Pseudomonadota bacterium]
YDLFFTATTTQPQTTKTIWRAKLRVLPDPRDGAGDFRTQAEITLDAIDAVLARKATSDQKQLTIDGQTLIRYSFDELQVQRDRYKAIVDRERRELAGQKPRGRSIQMRMR